MIIGISGRRGTGKTTVADHFVKKYDCVKLSFASDLRAIAKTLMPFVDSDFVSIAKKEHKFKQYDWTPREFLINLGEFMRYHDTSYWVNMALARCVDSKKVYVFDDCRYKNEADAIKALGGEILRIGRYEKFNPYGKNLDIPSESDLDDYKWDAEIHPQWNTTISELFRQSDAFMDGVVGG